MRPCSDISRKSLYIITLLKVYEETASCIFVITVITMLTGEENPRLHPHPMKPCFIILLVQLLVIPLVVHLIAYSTTASFPGHRRNGLATCVSSNSYFYCQKFGSTNQIQIFVTWW